MQKALDQSFVLPQELQGQISEGFEEKQTVLFYSRRVQDALQRFNRRETIYNNLTSYYKNRLNAFIRLSKNSVTLSRILFEILSLKEMLSGSLSLTDIEENITARNRLESLIKLIPANMQPDLKRPLDRAFPTTPTVLWLTSSSPIPYLDQKVDLSAGQILVFIRPVVGK